MGLLLLGAVAGAAGCGDDSGGDETPPPPSESPATAKPTGPGAQEATGRPADRGAAGREVAGNWEKFFDPDVPNEEKREVLQNGGEMALVLEAFNGDERGEQVAAEVTDVAFTSTTGAEVTYTLTLKGATALPDASGTAVLQDDVWKVSVKTLCALVRMSGDDPEASGC